MKIVSPEETLFRYQSNCNLADIATRIRSAKRVLVTTHSKPDGDAIGSVLAVLRMCRALSIEAEGWIVGPFEENLLEVVGSDAVVRVDPKAPHFPGDAFDLAVVVDTGAWSQIELLAPWIRARVDSVVNLDHHARGDAIASARVVDVTCGSCTALLVRLADELQIDLGFGANDAGRYSLAEALYVGLATDTGWFRFANARAGEFAIAARLLTAGVHKDEIYARLEQCHRLERVLLESRALSSLRTLACGTVALMSLSKEDFAATGGLPEELAGVVNLPMMAASLRASVLLVEQDGVIKVSFRSKPAVAGGDFLDVNQLAATFGGGGHVHAAGARIKGTLAHAAAEIERALAQSSL
ncbi:MAG: hypothetical protein EXS10_01020 [Phycisphaerales bacterium]|nr:hypothetical protein [Phycisphaerales bacterium]